MMGFGFMGIFGMLMMVLFWGGLLFLGIWIARELMGSGGRLSDPSNKNHRSPRETLDARYARGEIDRDTYEQIKRDLSQQT